MRSEISTNVPAAELAESARAIADRAEFAQRLLMQIVVGRRCQRAVLGTLEEVRLTDSQFLVLWGIDQLFPTPAGKGVGQSEVAQTLGISPAQVSGLVEQLRKQGDLRCERAPHDRRLQLWQLTGPGRERLQQALRCVADLDLDLLSWPDLPANSLHASSGETHESNAASAAPRPQGEAA